MLHQSLIKNALVQRIIDEQKRYSIQQMNKIEQSNHKLNLIEEKMKSLLLHKNHNKYNQYHQLQPQQQYNQLQPQQDNTNNQIDKYYQSSKKHPIFYQHNDNKHSQQSQDMLLENNSHQYQTKRSSTMGNNNYEKQKYINTMNNNNNRNSSTNRSKVSSNKNSTSLKLFNHKNHNNSNSNNNNSTHKLNKNHSKNNHLVNNNNKNQQSQSQNHLPQQQSSNNYQSNPYNNNLYKLLTPYPNNDLYQINQLQLIMQKSLSIKSKQLILAKQQLQKLQHNKLQQYRKNIQLEIQFSKIKQFKLQAKVNPINQTEKFFNQPEDIKIKTKISTTKQQLNTQYQKLLKQLKKLEQQEYNLKLQKKKQNFQLHSMERQFNKILKLRSNKIKENIQQNYQKNNQQTQNRMLNKKNPSVKTFKTHKKYSVSTFDKQLSYGPTDRERQQRTVQKKVKSKIDLSKSKEKFVTPVHQNTQSKYHGVSKSTSCSVINRNRHMLAQCQNSNKNCETDKILYDMVHELDKLKDIVTKDIVKTRSKKGQRRVIELYGQRDSKKKEKLVMMR